MPRPSEEILEFDRLRELLRRRTTCAPGRRAIDALGFQTDRTLLEGEFAAVAEAVAWLRTGREVGFGALADPESWLAQLEKPGAVLSPAELLDAATLADTAQWLRLTFHDDIELRPGPRTSSPRETRTWSAAEEKDALDATDFPLLAASARGLRDFRPLAAAIRKAILPNGEISDNASPALRRIRDTLGRSRETLHKTLLRIVQERARDRGQPPGEDYVTQRNDRFVIPVRAAEQRSIQGVVHAASATGQTVFVEPFETIELNNRLVQLSDEETAEIARILEEITARLTAERPALVAAVAIIAQFDSRFARARFAREFDACMPVLVDEPLIALDAARHPVLEDSLRAQGRAIVPMSLTLGGGTRPGPSGGPQRLVAGGKGALDATDTRPRLRTSSGGEIRTWSAEEKDATDRALVISGPNTGGKTVALKTVGLAVLAAQAGIPVAAQSARLGIFDRVLADIGDEQSIAADLSTFSAHMLNLNFMLGLLTERSLVLVDELGTGTAPEEGAALAVALLDEFRARGCLVLATTHHDRLKAYASTTPGVVNASVEFDDVRLAPTYRLRVGVPGGSSGIDIAMRLGLPATIVERARSLITPEAREAAGLIAYLHRSRDAVERMQRELAAEMKRLEDERRELREDWVARQKKRIAELEARFAEALASHEKRTAQALATIEDQQLRAQIEKQAKRRGAQARAEARDEADAAVVAHLAQSQADLGVAAQEVRAPTAAELVAGARVRVRGFSAPVVLRRRDESSAEVEAGPLRMKVPLSEIVAIVSEPPAKSGGGTARVGAATAGRPGSITVHAAPAENGGETDEINVIGCTVEEAVRRVDKFIDNAALAGKPEVRIVHGYGTGALRRGLAAFLAEHPLVERIHAEAHERGGEAVTVAELKG